MVGRLVTAPAGSDRTQILSPIRRLLAAVSFLCHFSLAIQLPVLALPSSHRLWPLIRPFLFILLAGLRPLKATDIPVVQPQPCLPFHSGLLVQLLPFRLLDFALPWLRSNHASSRYVYVRSGPFGIHSIPLLSPRSCPLYTLICPCPIALHAVSLDAGPQQIPSLSLLAALYSPAARLHSLVGFQTIGGFNPDIPQITLLCLHP